LLEKFLLKYYAAKIHHSISTLPKPTKQIQKNAAFCTKTGPSTPPARCPITLFDFLVFVLESGDEDKRRRLSL
jgi:hypothetical protein